jgi:hypothetical protein
VVLDRVGVGLFQHTLVRLDLCGRLIEMSVTGLGEVTFNFADFDQYETA